MNPARVTYRLDEAVATIRLDDGKSNALSPAMFAEINAALDRAEQDRAVVVLTGREGVFSAGFDLKVLRRGGTDTLSMLRSGFELAERVLSFPTPVVVACSGHTFAMGVFLTASADYRFGAAGAYKYSANEVAIGLPVPRWAVEVCRHRLSPAHFNRALLLAETFTPEGAAEAGILDRVVPQEELEKTAQSMASELSKLDMKAHAATKQRARAKLLRDMRTVSRADFAEYVVEGTRLFLTNKLRGSTRAASKS
jgi:enoyl-CoA hydratase